MNYKIVEKEGKFSIIEKATNQYIKIFDDKEKARKLLRQLNFGGGFDGWTPKFFLLG
jgi:hypothetical protein